MTGLLMRNITLFDGAMGTMLQKNGLEPGDLPEMYCLTHPQIVTGIHREYAAAGAQVITTNTFGANALHFSGSPSVDDIVRAGIECARAGAPGALVAQDIGPLGALMQPYGDLSYAEVYELFAQQVRAGEKYGPDMYIIETMSDLREAKTALLAVKENSSRPVFVTMTFGADGHTFLGVTPEAAAMTLSAMGAQAIGVNCSLGPDELLPTVQRMYEFSRVPLIIQPNAGLPEVIDGKTEYKITPEQFCAGMEKMLPYGAAYVGGCCGTMPDFTRALARLIDGREAVGPADNDDMFFVCSPSHSVILRGNETAVIGERINPTGKKKLKEALRNSDYDYILGEARNETQAGADILDVNAGLPELNEPEVLTELISRLQSAVDLPLQLDSSDPDALDKACRRYAGRPVINSVNGRADSLAAILPIAKKYGAAVVGLTLDENGIPDTAEGRFAIAKKIMDAALAAGLSKNDIMIDCLVLTASTNQALVPVTLAAIRLVRSRLGLRTVLGVSNVSFGLPARPMINSVFLAAAFGAGLTCPIINPLNEDCMNAVRTFRMLNDEDKGAQSFISFYSQQSAAAETPAATCGAAQTDARTALPAAVVRGDAGEALSLTRSLLETGEPVLDIINGGLVPGLDEVGVKYGRGEMFLPQLMGSARAVQAAFDILKDKMPALSPSQQKKVVLATVRGDIHDIGKNIVKMVLSSYGFSVLDLGRDTDIDLIIETVKRENIRLVGLSALMTTSVASMKKTVEAVHASCPGCKVMVGGAVLTDEYAAMVGADYYGADAPAAVKIATEVLG